MRTIRSNRGVTISWDEHGSGPALVLVHGAFSDHGTNWEFVIPHLREHFAVYSIARRGRGETTATEGHSIEDEAKDVVDLIHYIGRPVYLVGHSYGAQVCLVAASMARHWVRKLIAYEAALPTLMTDDTLETLTSFADTQDWSSLSYFFFRDILLMPEQELNAILGTPVWDSILADAPPTLQDLRALHRYDFQPERFRGFDVPVMLQVGSESPRHLYATDALIAVLRDVHVDVLIGQAHEGMTTAPEQYADSLIRYLGRAAVASM